MRTDTPSPNRGDSSRAVDALLRVKDIEDQKSRKAFLRKQRQVQELQLEISALRQRRDAILRRSGKDVLRERLLLDALLRATLERTRDLASLRRQAGELLKTYREVNRGRKAVTQLRVKRIYEDEVTRQRRGEQEAGDLAAARVGRGADDAPSGAGGMF